MSDTPASELITIERKGSTLVARLPMTNPTELDMSALGQKVDQAAREPGISTVMVDLTGVQMLPSLGLGALVQMANKCRARQQKLQLGSCSPQLRQTFTVTRLDRFFDLVDKCEPEAE
jgi:anti-anti-sigma factor